jgi:hypothetical protein
MENSLRNTGILVAGRRGQGYPDSGLLKSALFWLVGVCCECRQSAFHGTPGETGVASRGVVSSLIVNNVSIVIRLICSSEIL